MNYKEDVMGDWEAIQYLTIIILICVIFYLAIPPKPYMTKIYNVDPAYIAESNQFMVKGEKNTYFIDKGTPVKSAIFLNKFYRNLHKDCTITVQDDKIVWFHRCE